MATSSPYCKQSVTDPVLIHRIVGAGSHGSSLSYLGSVKMLVPDPTLGKQKKFIPILPLKKKSGMTLRTKFVPVWIHMIDGAGSPGSSMFKLCLACRLRVRVEIYQIQIWPSRKNGSGNSDPGVHTGSSSDLRENIGAGSDPLETEYFIRMLPRKKIGYNPLEKIGSGDWWL